MKEKDYTHCPREICDARLLRAEWLKSRIPKPTFIELSKDGLETELKDHRPQRCFEFNSAGYLYLDDVAKALCTHHKDALFLGDEVYIRSIVGRDMFFDLAIGEFKEQYHRLMMELGRMDNRRCYVPNGKGGYYVMHPYIIVPESISLEKFNALPEQERQRLLNTKNSLIEQFHLYFAQSLYKPYLDGGQYYQHPKNMTAKIWHIISQLDINTNKDGCLVAYRDYYPEINYKELLFAPRFVAGYMRVIDYLYEHGAGNHTSLVIDRGNMLKKCCPSLIKRHKDGRILIRDHREYEAFLKMVVIITTCLDGFDYKLKRPPIVMDESENKLFFEFEHSQRIIEINQKRAKVLMEAKNKNI
jgi:hypothetical protein